MLPDERDAAHAGNWQDRLLHRPVCDLLGCRLPLALTGMDGAARAELAAAAAKAGAFGFLGMGREPVAIIREQVAQLRAAGVSRFGVHLVSSAADAALLDAQADACIDLRVPVLGLFRDVMPGLIRRAADAGILVVQQAGSPGDARRAEAAGAGVLLVVQGVAAGGHVRAAVQLLAQRLAEVLTAARVPVLAACGVSDGADLATLLALGAQGAMLDMGDVDAVAGADERVRRIAAEAAQRLRTAADEPPPIELSSPVCYAREFELMRDDVVDRPSLVAGLDALLEGARAGVRLSLSGGGTDNAQAQLAALHRDELKWCGMLIAALHSLGAAPSTRTAPFYAETALVAPEERLAAMLQRRQGAAAQQLRALLPKVVDERLSDGLAEMLGAYRRTLIE